MPKMTGNNRISALKRLNKPYQINNSNRRLLSGPKDSSIKDARQILANRNKTAFDARQLLSRQSSKTVNTISKNVILRNNLQQNNEDMVVVTGLKDMKMKDGRLIPSATMGRTQLEQNKKIYAVGPSTFVTIRNKNNNNTNISLNQSTEKISLTKTIANTYVRREDDDRSSQTANALSSSANQKVVISFVNDKYEKTPTSSQPTTTTKSSSPLTYHRDSPSAIKRLHDASIQTTPSSSSRSPIRISSYRRQNSTTMNEQDHSPERTIGDLYEPPVKRTTSSARKTTAIDKEQQVLSTVTSTGSVKRTSTGAPVSSRLTSSVSTVSKQPPPTQSSSNPGTILVTNLQPSVSEDDAIELFGEIGRINEITTLSQGCIQIVYAKREHGELAVTKYHNRLLDGQFMYVSLQQSSSNSKVTSNVQQPSSNPKVTSTIQQPSSNSKTASSIQKPTRENETSVSSASTTNQPLKFNASKNTSNKIAIDPAFIRQALFHPSNSATNPVQFQVKL